MDAGSREQGGAQAERLAQRTTEQGAERDHAKDQQAAARVDAPEQMVRRDRLAQADLVDARDGPLDPAADLLSKYLTSFRVDSSSIPAASFLRISDGGGGRAGVDERSVGNLRHLADHHLLILRFDVLRRFWAIDKLRERIKSEGPLAFLRFAAANVGKYENAELAARFDTLRKLPPDTLGAEYINYMDRNGFPLPGHKGAISDIIAYHDMTHVLSGYGTDPAGEVQVASFSAGYRRREPFTFVLFVLLQFHVGVRMTPGAAAERGYFDVEKALVALERGAAMNIDLSEGWDYWEVIDHPVQDLRIRYNIPPYSE